MLDKVQAVLDKVRPMLQCKGCPMSQMTLRNGIERIILKEIPGVKGVEAVQE
ncbi:NifU family protein [uncultured Pseudodesulfovibrio sp.]|uniref:NifU family protein n=1 Tax=uncultured Pseudodesulfovibrio sp. TaxID=2035858 RepID=UPI0029C7C96B|nr:NifU family protein [uncultured Pseudodesulfovibrio sp.]